MPIVIVIPSTGIFPWIAVERSHTNILLGLISHFSIIDIYVLGFPNSNYNFSLNLQLSDLIIFLLFIWDFKRQNFVKKFLTVTAWRANSKICKKKTHIKELFFFRCIDIYQLISTETALPNKILILHFCGGLTFIPKF